MIITLTGADFSASNIGTLSTWRISRSLGGGATYDGPTSVDKGAALNATVTLAENYEVGTAGVTVTMGGAVLSGAHSISGSVITITIASVTGNVLIKVPTVNTSTGEEDEPDVPVTPPSGGSSTLTLRQGYADGATINTSQANRVWHEGFIQGAFSITLNSGYLIRAIWKYNSTNYSDALSAVVTSDQQLTTYTNTDTSGYYAITFSKSDASVNLSPTENIISSFTGTVVASTGDSTTDDTVAGTDVPYTLVQGAHVQNDSSIFQADNRVTTPKAIKGKFTVTVNSGYAIRAVYEYTKESGDTNGTMVATTSEDRTTFTSTNDNKYYGVTFTYASPNAANNIAPTENIVAEWKYV